MFNADTIIAPILKGAIKRFGEAGPRYQIGEAIEPLENGDWLYEITVLESGEKTKYRLSRIENDPETD